MSHKRQPQFSAETNRLRTMKPGGTALRGLTGLLLLLWFTPISLAQVVSSSTLRGVVKDPSGGLVPNAAVKLTSSERGGERRVKTNGEGSYLFTSVDPGLYELRIEAAGFKAFEQIGIILSPGDSRSLDVVLEIGAPTETVMVNGETAPIKTDTGERSDTITAKQLDNLSLIGRSGLELLRIMPGVVGPDPSDPNQSLDFNTFGGGANASANYSVNGMRGLNNSMSIDGSRVIDIGSNSGTIITPNVDMVQEVTVKTSNYAAEYGTSAVQILATTKAGGKQFHGEVYDYIRPKPIQANDRSNSVIGSPRPNTSFQYPGGQIGGPVLLPFTNFNRNRDKLFFFFAFEVQRQKRDPGSRLGLVPTAAERSGDFSKSASGFHDQAGAPVICPPETFNFETDDNGNATCTPVAGGNLTGLVNPVGKALLGIFPMPNFVGTGATARYNYSSAITAPENRTDMKMRFDYQISKTSIYIRLARETESDESPYGIWWAPSTFELPSHVVGRNLGRSAAANISSVLSPTMTNEIVISGSKLKLDYDFRDPAKVSRSALGVQNLQLPFGPQPPTAYGPLALFSWDTNSQMWEPGGTPLFAFSDSYSVNETLSKVHKNHTLKFGGGIERAGKLQNFNSTPEGLIEYEGINQARTTGNAFANLYTGRISGIDQTTKVPTGNFRFWNVEGFAQDSWKFKSNITVEAGLRLSYYPNNTETTGLGVVFDPSSYLRGGGPYLNGNLETPNGVRQAKLGQIPNGVFSSNPAVLFSPRLNVAWDLFKDGSTVLRGGAGVFYNRGQGNYQYQILEMAPNLLSVHADSWGAPNNDINLNNLASFNPTLLAPGANCRENFTCPSITSQDLNSNVIPRSVTTSLSLARRLPFQNVLEVAYVGTFGRHLPQYYQFNFVEGAHTAGTLGNANLADPLQRAAVGSSVAALAQLVPFPDYGDVRLIEFTGTSNYHSLQVTLNRQLGQRVQYFVTYTFSKALGTIPNETDSISSPDPVDTRGKSYGVLSYDRTHIFNVSYNYYLPKLARGSFDNLVTRALLNGWQMSGITTVQSGKPMRVKLGGALNTDSVLFAYFGNTVSTGGPNATGVAPVLLRNPLLGNQGVGQSYLDLSAIAIPAFGTNGPSQPPYYVRSPTTNNFDVTFLKNFVIKDTRKLQFRAGFFNIFNEAFPNPDLGDFGSLTLNTVCNASAPAGINDGIGQTTNPICDPTKGFSFDQNTIDSFGKVINKHDHRRIELALKFYF